MAASVLLFDLDGTLVDSNDAHAEAFARAAAGCGIPIPRDRFAREIGKGADHVVQDVFGPAFEAERGDAFRDAAGEHFREIAADRSIRVFDGARRAVQQAREAGYRTALATSSSEGDLDALFASAGYDFRESVDYVTSASDVEASKPAPDLVRVVAEHFGVPAAACVLVGDTVYDGLAARRGGAAFVGVATYVWSRQNLAGAGARATCGATADLAARLDVLLAEASPGDARLTAAAADALMLAALGEARAAFDAGNAPIGAVVGRADGTVLARGRNRSASAGDRLRHAELEALHDLLTGPGREDGLVLATTLEPCSMCLGALTEAGVWASLHALEAPTNGALGHVEAPPGRALPLASAWSGSEGEHRAASRDLVRRGAARDGGFLATLLDCLRD